jgi:hypothetical protein
MAYAFGELRHQLLANEDLSAFSRTYSKHFFGGANTNTIVGPKTVAITDDENICHEQSLSRGCDFVAQLTVGIHQPNP